MSWNQQGGDKDPWGGGKGSNDGPPDLTEALDKLRRKFGGGGNGNGGGNGGLAFSLPLLVLIAVILLMAFSAMRGDPHWALGVYKVDARERAVVLRFGKFETVKTEGLQWNVPYLDTVYIVQVTNVREHSASGLMLTEDEAIVDVPVSVQWDVKDLKAFVLNVRDPEISLKHATDSAVRHVVGSSKLDSVLGDGRVVLSAEVEKRLQDYLDSYGTGINIVKVNLLKVEPPREVKQAFDDVIAAKEDKERFGEQAEAYRNEIVPVARGLAKRMEQDAIAYKERVIASAEGEARRFEQLLAEYKKAPEVTRERLYIDAVQEVMNKSTKVMVDTKGSGNLLYLPLDKLMTTSPTTGGSSATAGPSVDEVAEEVIRRIRQMQDNQNRGARR